MKYYRAVVTFIFAFITPLFFVYGGGRVEPGEDFESHADICTHRIDERFRITLECEISYEILSDNARTEFSFYSIPYEISNQNVDVISAYSVTNGVGKLVSKKVLKGNGGLTKHSGGVSDIAAVIVPFTNLKIGSIINLKYTVSSKKNIIKNGVDIFTGFTNSYIGKNEKQIFISKVPLDIHTSDLGVDYKITRRRVAGEYHIEIKGNYRTKTERKDIKHYIVQVSTFKNWQIINQELSAAYEKIMQQPMPLLFLKWIAEAKKLNGLDAQLDFLNEKISQHITYAGQWQTINQKFLPKGYRAVLESKNGDCKDFSTLLTGMLRRLKHPAFVALTYRGSPSETTPRREFKSMIPGLSMFNHAIVAIRLANNQVRWVDPTNSYVVSDYLLSDILGSPSLILDGKSNHIHTLPEMNDKQTQMVVDRKFTILPDQTTYIDGSFTANKYAKIEIESIKRQFGENRFKELFMEIIALNNVNKNSSLKFEGGDVMKSSFRLSVRTPVMEVPNKYKQLHLVHPASILLYQIRKDEESYIGEPGTTHYASTLPKESVIDSTVGSCFIKSKWVDIEREVENQPQELIVRDTVVKKQRYIEIQEIKSDDYKVFIEDLYACIQNPLLVHINPTTLSAEDADLFKRRGLAVEKMTDAQIEELLNSQEADLFNYKHKKAFMYYRKKIRAGEQNPLYYSGYATALRNLGYMKGDVYTKSYLDAAIEEFLNGLKLFKDHLPLLTGLGETYLYQGDQNKALAYLNLAFKKAAKSPETAILAAKIARFQKKYNDAENWLLAGVNYAGTDSKKVDLIESELWRLYYKQGNLKRAKEISEKKIARNPENAWTYHNLALIYEEEKNWDKVIEIEKKTLERSYFGLAAKTLATAYMQKSHILYNEAKDMARKLASVTPELNTKLNQAIEMGENSLKYSPDEPQLEFVLWLLSEAYGHKFESTHDENDWRTAKAYLERGKKINKTIKGWDEHEKWLNRLKG